MPSPTTMMLELSGITTMSHGLRNALSAIHGCQVAPKSVER
jgi:hypothetical protein